MSASFSPDGRYLCVCYNSFFATYRCLPDADGGGLELLSLCDPVLMDELPMTKLRSSYCVRFAPAHVVRAIERQTDKLDGVAKYVATFTVNAEEPDSSDVCFFVPFACGQPEQCAKFDVREKESATLWPYLGSVYPAHKKYVQHIEFHPTRAFMATASGDGTVAIYNAVTLQRMLLFTDHTSYTNAVAFAPGYEGRKFQYMASGGGDSKVFQYRLELGPRSAQDSELESAPLVVHKMGSEIHCNDSVRTITYASTGEFFAVGSLDSSARVVRTEDMTVVHKITTFSNAVDTSCWLSGDNYIAFGGWDSSFMVYGLREGTHVLHVPGTPKFHTGWYRDVNVRRDGRVLVTANEDTDIALWALPDALSTPDTENFAQFLCAMHCVESDAHKHLSKGALYDRQLLGLMLSFLTGRTYAYRA